MAHDSSNPSSHGPIEGKLLSDEKFSLDATKTQLGAGGRYSIVHIASHFVAESGAAEESFLMLGAERAGGTEGYALTLSKMQRSVISFHGIKLLTLSACSTAMGEVAQDGLEMESLGMIAQQKDAEAVLATLWDLNDASTSLLMSDFYTRWMKNPTKGKGEALRQAQLALLRGSAVAPSGGKEERGLAVDREADSDSNPSCYSHPYYWAPFVLVGNYQ